MGVEGNTVAIAGDMRFQYGRFLTGSAVADGTNVVDSQFGVDFSATPGQFRLRNVANNSVSTFFTGTQAVSWYINNTGSALSYTAPGGAAAQVAHDTADIYVGNQLVFDDIAQPNSNPLRLHDFKISWTTGVTLNIGTVFHVDNILVSDITPVPEPGASTWIAAAAAGWALLRRPRRPKR